MKRVISFAFLTCIIFICNVFAPANSPNETSNANKVALSSLSEFECLEFLSVAGVVIPDEFKINTEMSAGVKKMIEELEENPDKKYVISYTVARDFIEDIRAAVKNYLDAETATPLS